MTSVTICFPRRASILVALACAGLRELHDAARKRAGDAAKGRERRPAGCATAKNRRRLPLPPHVPSKSEQDLDKGIRSYEDGEYKTSAKQLQAALDLGLDAARDRARAHKYLAFIACVSGRKKACRDEFNKALDADPKFDLEPAEAGHPIWGPVWRSVKTARAVKPKTKPK